MRHHRSTPACFVTSDIPAMRRVHAQNGLLMVTFSFHAFHLAPSSFVYDHGLDSGGE